MLSLLPIKMCTLHFKKMSNKCQKEGLEIPTVLGDHRGDAQRAQLGCVGMNSHVLLSGHTLMPVPSSWQPKAEPCSVLYPGGVGDWANPLRLAQLACPPVCVAVLFLIVSLPRTLGYLQEDLRRFPDQTAPARPFRRPQTPALPPRRNITTARHECLGSTEDHFPPERLLSFCFKNIRVVFIRYILYF